MQKKFFQSRMPMSLHLRLEYAARMQRTSKTDIVHDLIHNHLPKIDPVMAPDLAKIWSELLASPENQDDPYLQQQG